MHLPPSFVEDDLAVLAEMIESVGFGHLVVAGPEGLASTPLPVLVSLGDTMTLRGHLARPNAVWQSAPCDALLIVPVSDAYITPSWYPSKTEHGKVVPTWNYEVVHAHGRLIAHDDPVWVDQLVRDLTVHHESSRRAPWSVDDAPADYIDKLLNAIVGVEIEITRLVGKRKLSQNKTAEDRAGVLAGLHAEETRKAREVATSMERRAP